MLDNVTLAYLPQNSPPVVKSINVTDSDGAGAAAQRRPAAVHRALYRNGDGYRRRQRSALRRHAHADAVARRAPSRSRSAGRPKIRTATAWFTTSISAAKRRRRWKLMKGDLHENAFTFDGDVLADGKYYFRVVASDREVNPPATARGCGPDQRPGA